MDYWSEREGWTGVERRGKVWMMLLCICLFYPSCGGRVLFSSDSL
jgi:hypothetical protein